MAETRPSLPPKAQAFDVGASSPEMIEVTGATVHTSGPVSMLPCNPVSQSSSICSDDNKDSTLLPDPLVMSRTTIKSWLCDIPDVSPTKSQECYSAKVLSPPLPRKTDTRCLHSQHKGDVERAASLLQATISVKPYTKVAHSLYQNTDDGGASSAIDGDSDSDSDGTLQYLEVDSPGSTQRRNSWEEMRYSDGEALVHDQAADATNGEKTTNSKVDMEIHKRRDNGFVYMDLGGYEGITSEEERNANDVDRGNATNNGPGITLEKAVGLERNHSQNSTDSTRSTKTVHCDEGTNAAVPFVAFAKTRMALSAAIADPKPEESYAPEPSFKRSYVAETHNRSFSTRSCTGSVGSNSSDRSLVSSTSRFPSWSCKPGLGVWTKRQPGSEESEEDAEKSTRTMSTKSTRSKSSMHANCAHGQQDFEGMSSEVHGRVSVNQASATFTPQPSASPIGVGGPGSLGATVEERRRRFMQLSDAESASGTAIRPRSRSGSRIEAAALSAAPIATASSTAATTGVARGGRTVEQERVSPVRASSTSTLTVQDASLLIQRRGGR